MEYNIERSSSVSMFKKQRKLDDGRIVWDSVVKLRKKNPAQCSKAPKAHLGIRNNWIKEFSNMLSEKASSYLLETMSAERTNRQEEIAQTLLNRFNDFLEQDASLKDPQTLTHKAMVTVADKLSLWLDKNVKVSKNVGIQLQQIEEEEKRKRLMEEMLRLEQERRDRDEEKKRKKAEGLAEPKSAREVMQPPPEPDPMDMSPERDEGGSAMEPIGDDKLQAKDDKPPGEGSQDGQQEQIVEPHPPSTDEEQKTEGQMEDTEETGDAEQTTGESLEGKVDGTGRQESKTDEPDANQQAAVNQVPPDSTEAGVEDVTETLQPSSSFEEDVIKIESESVVEPDVSDGSPIRNVLGVEGEQSARETEDTDTILSSYPAPDTSETPLETLSDTQSEVPGNDSVPPSSSDFSDRDDMNLEPSKDSAALVDELLASSKDEKDIDDIDLIDINLIGKSADKKTDMVLNELAEMIAKTKEEHSPLQEAIKDIMEKELEERLGDKDAETINEVAGKVGTWMDKMVERAAEEYGESRSSSRGRPMSPRTVSLPTDRFGASVQPQARRSPAAAVPKAPTPQAILPESIARSSFKSTGSPSPQPPVSQKPKGPIFKLRKVDTKNIFNVAGVTHTKAKRKIREARGQSASSKRISQESLDIEEWAEWAGLVSDVGQNWAKWVEDVAQRADRHDVLSYDAKEWKNISKQLQREGEVWMKKVVRKQNKQKTDLTPEAKPMSA